MGFGEYYLSAFFPHGEEEFNSFHQILKYESVIPKMLRTFYSLFTYKHHKCDAEGGSETDLGTKIN